jgi:hypothetical protein
MKSNSNYTSPSAYRKSAPGFPAAATNNSFLAGTYNFTIADIEVFSLKFPSSK